MHKKLVPALIGMLSACASARAMNMGQAFENIHQSYKKAPKKDLRYQTFSHSDSEDELVLIQKPRKSSYIASLGLFLSKLCSSK